MLAGLQARPHGCRGQTTVEHAEASATMRETRVEVSRVVNGLLDTRHLTRPDGRPLWQYGITDAEFLDIERALKAFFEARTLTNITSKTGDIARDKHVIMALGLYTALRFQRHFTDGIQRYEFVLSPLDANLSPLEARDIGKLYAEASLDHWRIPRTARQERHILTLCSQAGVQLARLASTGRESWGTLRPFERILERLADEDASVHESLSLLQAEKTNFPDYYQSDSALSCLSVLIQWFWVAKIDQASRFPDERSEDIFRTSLTATQHQVEHADRLPVNDQLIAIYKVAFQEIESAIHRRKHAFRADILLQPTLGRSSWMLQLYSTAPTQLPAEMRQRVEHDGTRVVLAVDVGDNHYQVAHYYRPYEGDFELERYVQRSPAVLLDDLSDGIQFTLAGHPVHDLPAVPLDVPLIFEAGSHGMRYVGSYGSTLQDDHCIVLVPVSLNGLPNLGANADCDVSMLGSYDDPNGSSYTVHRLSLPTSDTWTREHRAISLALPCANPDVSNAHVTLLAERTCSTVLAPVAREIDCLRFRYPSVTATTAFRTRNFALDDHVSRSADTCGVRYLPYGTRKAVERPNYGIHRVIARNTALNVDALHVVVIPPQLRFHKARAANGRQIQITPSVAVGRVRIRQAGNRLETLTFDGGQTWTLPTSTRVDHAPKYYVQFLDWHGEPEATLQLELSEQTGFVERSNDGLHHLTTASTRYRAHATIGDLPSLIFTARPQYARGKDLTLRAQLHRRDAPQPLMLRHWTVARRSDGSSPLLYLGDIVEELRAMMRVDPHVDDTVVLSSLINGTEHKLIVRRDHGALQRTAIGSQQVIRPATPCDRPSVLRQLYAPARLLLLEAPESVVDITYEESVGGWPIPEERPPGTYLFLTAKELFRPFLLPEGETDVTTDWAKAAGQQTPSDRAAAFSALFQRYAEGLADDSVPRAIQSLIQQCRCVEPTSFEGILELLNHPRALLRYLHIDHTLCPNQFEVTLRVLESAGMRVWTIPGYFWFEASQIEPQNPHALLLWPIVGQRSSLLARSLVHEAVSHKPTGWEHLLRSLLPFTASSYEKRLVREQLIERLNALPELEGTWIRRLVSAPYSGGADALERAIADVNQRPVDVDDTVSPTYPRDMRVPRIPDIQQALERAAVFIGRHYENDQIIPQSVLPLLLPLRWLAPSQFDLLCANESDHH